MIGLRNRTGVQLQVMVITRRIQSRWPTRKTCLNLKMSVGRGSKSAFMQAKVMKRIRSW